MIQYPIIYSRPGARTGIGWGVHTTVGDECKEANIKKALIVTTGLRGTGIIDEIKGILEYHGVSTDLFTKVTSNPKDHEIMEGYKAYKEAECDGIVSIGGGSSHDCGKGIRVVASNDGRDISEFFTGVTDAGRKKVAEVKPATVPQITVNTTAGTGAESNGGAAITDTQQLVKQGVMIPGLAATVALIDPLLIRCMPSDLAAWTGWDAFTHAFDSFLSKINTPPSAAIQLLTMKYVAENIKEFTYNRMNHIACEKMCWAETMGGGGMAFGAGGGIVHGFGNDIGAVTNHHHGRIMAVLTLPLQRFNQPACPEKFAEMAKAMGVDTTNMTTMQASDRWFDEVERLLQDLNIKPGRLMEQFGFEEKNVPHVVNRATSGFNQEGNPRDLNADNGTELLTSIL